jgi:hypothetical protein
MVPSATADGGQGQRHGSYALDEPRAFVANAPGGPAGAALGLQDVALLLGCSGR